MFLVLVASPCKGGFYVGGAAGLSFIQFIDKTDLNAKTADFGAYNAAFDIYTGYGIVSSGFYIGGRFRAGMDFANFSGKQYWKSPFYTGLDVVLGKYITPSTLVYIAPGLEISVNKYKAKEADTDWKSEWSYGLAINWGTRTLLTGNWFIQTEGLFLYHNKVIKDPESNKRALRFLTGLGYNF